MNIIKLLETDIKLFNAINSTGTCTIDQARQVYNHEDPWYHYKRIERLQKERLLLKHGKFLELTKRSAELIGTQKYRFNRPELRKDKAEVTDIMLSLNTDFISSRQLRNQYGLNRRTYFKGAVKVGPDYYFLYLLGNNPRQKDINYIRAEMSTLAISDVSRKSIVFAPTHNAMAAFGANTCKQDELFLLPYPAGIDIINQYFSALDNIKSLYPGEVSKKPFAHYETESHYITILILNDIAKRSSLYAYYTLPYQDKPVKIICLESQKKLFTVQFPQAEITLVDL